MKQNSFECLSKFLSKILRHAPDQFGIKLDVNHACNLEDLYEAVEKFSTFNREQVSHVIVNSKWENVNRFKIYNGKVKATFKHTYQLKRRGA